MDTEFEFVNYAHGGTPDALKKWAKESSEHTLYQDKHNQLQNARIQKV